MITVIVHLPPNVPSNVTDFITVQVEDDTIDRQPRSTMLEGLRNKGDEVVLTFTT